METKKISTYIEGLDEVLGGGFPVGHVVLLSGLPGTMKSTLSYAILHGNAKERGARCLYVSLEQTRKPLEDGILELKMHQITDVEVQRRIRVSKMRGAHHRTGFSALVFEDGRFQVTSVISV